MRLLLDTHAVLWAMTEPRLLGQTAELLILDPVNEVLLSAVVPWELSIKRHSGKLAVAAPVLADFPAVIAALAATPLAIDHRHAILAGDLSWDHKDPFDRMLGAQAALEGATLISRDPVFDTLPGTRRVW
ncbi:MAG: type II toxin-antitoxin system VapC family toxin [Bifidobacteriaceae bacterium]|jgi:PIN domain nuclease of toxin-antitoxin system|nr:type II toxin-antitoxin system VapC family toxin [Bifidobacteriaceae bacterium]